MPFYEYTPSSDVNCEQCCNGFTQLQKIADPLITECPQCHSPVKRIISAPNVRGGDKHLLKESTIEKAGFTQYRKVGKGKYEKTVGKQGPETLSS